MVHQVLKYWSLALLFLASATAVAQRPDTCVVWTDMFAHELAGARGWVRVEKTVPLAPRPFTMLTRPRSDTANAQGRLYLHLLRNSVVYMWSRYGVLGLAQGAPGTPVVIPDADSARLETLIPAQSIPSMYLVATRPVRVKHGADSALVNSILFSGTGVSVGFDSWTAAVDISAGAGDTTGGSSNPMFTAFETDIAALLDSIVARYGQVQAWTLLQGFLTAYSETDPVAAPLAATAQDTASKARLEVAAHAGRTDNPHSVSASQIGAATTAALASVEDTAQNANVTAATALTQAEAARDTASAAYLLALSAARDTLELMRNGTLVWKFPLSIIDTSGLFRLAVNTVHDSLAKYPYLWLMADTTKIASILDVLYARSGGGGTVDTIRILPIGGADKTATGALTLHDLIIPVGGSITAGAGTAVYLDSVRGRYMYRDSLNWVVVDSGEVRYIGHEEPSLPSTYSYSQNGIERTWKVGRVFFQMRIGSIYNKMRTWAFRGDSVNGVAIRSVEMKCKGGYRNNEYRNAWNLQYWGAVGISSEYITGYTTIVEQNYMGLILPGFLKTAGTTGSVSYLPVGLAPSSASGLICDCEAVYEIPSGNTSLYPVWVEGW